MSPPDPTATRDAAKQILQADEFQKHTSLIERIIDWIADRLSFKVNGSSGPIGIIGDLVFIALVVVVIYLLVRLVAGWQRRRRPTVDDSEPFDVEVERRQSADEWAREAEQSEAAGDHRSALRARYRELVARLVDDGTITDVVGRTAGELRMEMVASHPTIAPPFVEATDLFERAWYGPGTTTAAEVARERELATEVLARSREKTLEPA